MQDHGDDAAPGGDDERVRLIGADEAAKRADRDDVARRLPEGQPRFGDRPNELVGGKPAMSFPLAADTDATQIERPVPKGGSLFTRKAAADAGARSQALPPPTAPPVDLAPPSAAAASAAGGAEEPKLQHWAEPATGEVPAVLASDEPSDDSWDSYQGSQPRWKDQASDWADDEVAAMDPDATRAMTPGEAVEDPNERPRPVPAARSLRKPVDPPKLATAGSGGGGRDVQTAAAVGIGLSVGFLILVSVKPGAAMLMITAVVVLAAAELFAALRKPGFQPPTLLGLVAVGAMPMGVFWRGEQAMALILFLTVLFGMIWYIAGISSERPVANLAVTILAVVWIGMLGSYGALMLTTQDGSGMMIAAVLVTVGYDVAGFFGGRAFGHTPLGPISPNKTVEGLALGIVGSIVAASVVFVIGLDPFDEKFVHVLLLGIVGGLMAPLGDLAESMIKRDLRIKDMGTILPGHGGILDRFDGLLFVLPAVWYLGLLLNIVVG